LYAQQDTGKMTFHIKQTKDKNDGISISYWCKEKYKEIYVGENGGAYFFFGNQYNPNSASFLSDTGSISMIKKIVTHTYIDSLKRIFVMPTQCGYFIKITVDGISKYSVNIDDEYASKIPTDFAKLDDLIKLMDVFYNRYAFPK
jgi:hypothetical protein